VNNYWIEELKDFIRKRATKPAKLIGICFGHQIIAQALGGVVIRSRYGWNVGVRPLAIKQRTSWMQPTKKFLNLIFNHRDQVLRLPDGATLLAGDERCSVQMYTIENKILGIQAHPEYSAEYQEALMSVASELDEETYIEAKRNNQEIARDDKIALEWIYRFINM
jgi:GMP synthase-like glutamine amidotransferase